jgi:hypothetical protein
MSKLFKIIKQHPYITCLSLLTFTIYALLFGIYSSNDIDNTWSTAWIYHFYEHGITEDILFFKGDPTYWGVRFFSHIYCYIYGFILSHAGYTKYNVQFISLCFMMASLACWYTISKTILKKRNQILVFIFMLVWSGVFFAAANKARSDAMVFFFMSSAFLLWIRRSYFFSILSACIAIETHPIGGITLLYILSYTLCYDRKFFVSKKAILMAALALIIGILMYVSLHYTELGKLAFLVTKAQESHQSSNFLAAHFWGRGSYPYRYLPELLLFATAFIMHFIIYRKKDFFFPLTVLLMIISPFIFKRGNFHYAIFTYPAFLMLTVHAFAGIQQKRFHLYFLLVGWLLLLLPQYLFLAWQNAPSRKYQDYISQLQQFPFPKESLIYGMPADWFALYRYSGFRSITSPQENQERFIIEHQNTRFSQPNYHYHLTYDTKKWQLTTLATYHLQSGGLIRVHKVSHLP